METTVPGAAKAERLRLRMESLGIHEDALEEQFVQGFGPGGQKVNKTSSCVVLSYPAANLVIKCQRTRSRELNRYYARWELCERIAERTEGERSLRQQEAEKIRRQAKKHCLPSLPVLCNATGLRLCLAPTTARPTTGCVACGAAKNKNHLTFLVA